MLEPEAVLVLEPEAVLVLELEAVAVSEANAVPEAVLVLDPEAVPVLAPDVDPESVLVLTPEAVAVSEADTDPEAEGEPEEEDDTLTDDVGTDVPELLTDALALEETLDDPDSVGRSLDVTESLRRALTVDSPDDDTDTDAVGDTVRLIMVAFPDSVSDAELSVLRDGIFVVDLVANTVLVRVTDAVILLLADVDPDTVVEPVGVLDCDVLFVFVGVDAGLFDAGPDRELVGEMELDREARPLPVAVGDADILPVADADTDAGGVKEESAERVVVIVSETETRGVRVVVTVVVCCDDSRGTPDPVGDAVDVRLVRDDAVVVRLGCGVGGGAPVVDADQDTRALVPDILDDDDGVAVCFLEFVARDVPVADTLCRMVEVLAGEADAVFVGGDDGLPVVLDVVVLDADTDRLVVPEADVVLDTDGDPVVVHDLSADHVPRDVSDIVADPDAVRVGAMERVCVTEAVPVFDCVADREGLGLVLTDLLDDADDVVVFDAVVVRLDVVDPVAVRVFRADTVATEEVEAVLDAVVVLVEVLDAVDVEVPNRAVCVGASVGRGVTVALTERVLVFDCVDDAVTNTLPNNNWRAPLSIMNEPCASSVGENDDNNNASNSVGRIVLLSGREF